MSWKLICPIASAVALSCAGPNNDSTVHLTSAQCMTQGCDVGPGRDRIWRTHANGGGTSVQIAASPDQAWAAAHAAMRWNHSGVPVDYRGEAGQLFAITKSDSDTATYENTQVGVWVDPMNADKVELTVVVMGPDEYEVGGPNEKQVLKDIGTAVALLKAGRALPEARP